ncbi:MAG: hypothetical protein HRU41_33385 [Saprospiraceae bacterium]|nr:hypothetical protein [Saprospiraceae bacterium]
MKKRIQAFLNSPWTITLISTTIGVYLGIFLNEHYATKAEQTRANLAFTDVLSELEDNYEDLLEWDSISVQNFEFFSQLRPYIEDYDEMVLRMHPQKMIEMRDRYPKVLIIEDTNQINDSTSLYDVTFDLDFNSQLVFIQHYEIAWSSMKNTDYVHFLDFSCIKSIEFFYRMYSYSNDLRSKWLQALMNQDFSAETLDQILGEWRMENQMNQLLIKSYPEIEKVLEECK